MYVRHSDGSIVVDASLTFIATYQEYLPVEAGENYRLAGIINGTLTQIVIYRYAFYDSSNTYITGGAGASTVTAPSGASFCRISFDTRQGATELFYGEESAVLDHIEKNKIKFIHVTPETCELVEANQITEPVVKDAVPEIEILESFVIHDNLLDGHERTAGTLIDDSNGEIVYNQAATFETYFDYISVEANTRYLLAGNVSGACAIVPMTRYAFYDSDHAFISGDRQSVAAGVEAPENASYIRISADKRNFAGYLLLNKKEIIEEHIQKNKEVLYKITENEIDTVEANNLSPDVYIPRPVQDSLVTNERLFTSILTLNSVNLIDRTAYVANKSLNKYGEEQSGNATDLVYCYLVRPNKVYSATMALYWFNKGWWLDDKGKPLSVSNFAQGTDTDTSPNGAYGIVFEVNHTSGGYTSEKPLMFVEGDMLPGSFVEYSGQYKIKPDYLPGAKGNKDWSPYYWVAMGDSRTAGYNHNRTNDQGEKIWDEGENEANYVQIIADKTGIHADNRSWPGAAFAYREGIDVRGGYTQSENLPAYTDIVTVFLGTNDCFNGLIDPNHGNMYGDRDNANDPYDVTTYMGAIRQLIKNIKLQCPLARILFISDSKLGFSGVPAFDGGKNKIDCLKEICAGYKIPILDLETCAQTGSAGNDYLEQKWEPFTDGLHESVVGHKFTAYAVAGEMLKYLW